MTHRYEQIRAIHHRQNSYTTYLDCMLISLSRVAMGLQRSGGTRTGCSRPLPPTLQWRFLLDMNRYEQIRAIHHRQNSYTTYLDCMLISLSRVAMGLQCSGGTRTGCFLHLQPTSQRRFLPGVYEQNKMLVQFIIGKILHNVDLRTCTVCSSTSLRLWHF